MSCCIFGKLNQGITFTVKSRALRTVVDGPLAFMFVILHLDIVYNFGYVTIGHMSLSWKITVKGIYKTVVRTQGPELQGRLG